MPELEQNVDGLYETEQDLSEIQQIRLEKLNALISDGENPFEKVKFSRDAYSADIHEKFHEYEGKDVRIAGRIMSRRDMGKANFIDIADSAGRIQCYVKVDDIGAVEFEKFKKWDIGDIAGVHGKVFRTRRGEISVHVYGIELLAKSLLQLPEKFHGLRDLDMRYRKRYVDLIINPEVRATFTRRSKIISEIRAFLDKKGFLEVETPVLNAVAAGGAARPFITHHNTLGVDFNLRIALELSLKRLIVGGFDRVYEIGRVFRNEGMDRYHNPEFTMLELYEAYTDYNGMMDLTEEMFRTVAYAVLGTSEAAIEGKSIDLSKPFERISMVEAVKKYSGVDFNSIKTADEAYVIAKEHKIAFEKRHKKGDILNLFFERYCEEKLIEPTFVTGHPVEISPLAKRMADNPEYTERFELFIAGHEYANAFSELNDPIDQRARFEEQAALKAAGDEEANEIDEDFLCALEHGMPPTGGLGVGVDRLVMLLTGNQSIRDVLLFPAMRPIEK